ncbi:BppU family phage baseplate upper protein [Bacillus anthracis]|uniref:BppU family phage baseplate upper protein n=1 Tax=Bacillus anthracis TaxID=1392 RepID=UPI002DBEB2EF|nr:BppU family phage baseplate upper protein [Bacillus anthracis]MEB9454147.1 BppU family phage baseplate upper protein [Bacillus anthracis]
MQHKDFNIKEEELKLIRFYQNDLNSAKLLINVTHDKVVTDFSSATSVQIAFLKPDCKRVFQDVQNVNQMQGKYYVVLSTQTLIAYGKVIAQLRFTFPNNKVIETCKFAFTVDESIMSDDAMKSTNEFPVIQKAIEAGKKLEGVDIDGIIAAGELAKGALPKTGGTMTGNLLMDNPTGAISQRYRAGATPVQVGWEALTNGQFRMFDWTNTRNVFSYDPVSDQVNINRNTNLLKKTGDTMTGSLIFDTAFTVRGSGASWDMRPYALGQYSKGVRHTINTANNFYAIAPIDEAGAANWSNQAALYGNTGVWDVKDINVRGGSASNVVTKLKDGRATLNLTADATAGSSNPQIATRRGNTVTLSLDLMRNAGATSAIVTTLPSDMTPVDSYTFDAIATDGTPSRVLIRFNGEIHLDVTGKRYRILATYVCN